MQYCATSDVVHPRNSAIFNFSSYVLIAIVNYPFSFHLLSSVYIHIAIRLLSMIVVVVVLDQMQ